MKLTIHLLGQARQLAVRNPCEIEIAEGRCLDDALPALLENADRRLVDLLSSEGVLRPGVMAILRDESIDPAAPVLADGDEVSLLPPMSGG